MRFRVEGAFHNRAVRATRLAALVLLLQSPSALAVESKLIASGLNQPLFVTAPQGDGRLFIVEKGGRIKVQLNGVVQTAPFLDISSLVRTASESGLLGMAFDPNFATPGEAGYRTFYVNYIDRNTRATVVAALYASLS